jgi:serine/threonine protein kinase
VGVRRGCARTSRRTSGEQRGSSSSVARSSSAARRAACVRHPSVIQTLEIDRTDGRHAADGALTGLVHGDLSPRQVLVSDQGEVKIGDFGQGDLRDVVSHVRSRYGIAYTAPEVACGLESDPRSDVFSLGVMLHEMLVAPRFAAKTPVEDVVKMVRDGRFHSSVLEPNLPRDLRAVIDRALEPNPAQRYPHARALAFDLRREMLRMGLCDAQTCIRQAVVGWCEVRGNTGEVAAVTSVTKSDVVPRSSNEDTSLVVRSTTSPKAPI